LKRIFQYFSHNWPPNSRSCSHLSALPEKNRTSKNITFLFKALHDHFIKITHTQHMLSRFLSLWLAVYSIVNGSVENILPHRPIDV